MINNNMTPLQYPLTFLHYFFNLLEQTLYQFFKFYNFLGNLIFDNNIDIYIDSSCITDPRQEITMGLGWHVTRLLTVELIMFSSHCKYFPSSTKAEAYAICTALLICPPQTEVNVYTDLQCCINTFYTITYRLTTPQRQLKIPNYHI
ncbi:ribonuclease H-like domain-containing protein [Rhizophagus clarus]|uniref:Ribonuclease H-like domain-containing protein n=1 Tax=Rhizophagus clarus TaxID=94130 RepID=A0A8H3M8B7_9GLOM|nr:ribonuclease H-like domain-containing protein [Rhizophagus clarus]